MPELDSLMDDLPEDLQPGAAAAVDDGDGAGDGANDDDNQDDDQGTDGAAGGSEDDDAGGDGDDAAGAGDDSEEDDEFDVDLDEEEQPAATPKPADNQPPITDEGQFILSKLPKISTRVIVPGADGKDEIKQVEVYGWGDLPRDFKGFATPYEQGVFTASAQNQELEARKLQTEFRQDKMKADTEAYTVRENQAIAKDLRTLRQEGLFPKFKGMPNSAEFNSSAGAKEFDRVIAFMNEQNDEAGKAAQSGEAFYHISFRQAYRMLHPEQFDKIAEGKRRAADKAVARRVKTGGGGAQPERNKQTARVSNINDLADEFAAFAGSSK